MQEFNFSVDVKMVTWERNTLAVKAENLEEARGKILAVDPDVFAGSADLPKDIAIVLLETNVYKPNDGELTYEIFDETTKEKIFSKIEVVSNNPITNLGNLESVSGGLKLI